MNDAETRLAARLGADLERVLGVGILVEDVDIAGDGPVTITVACIVDGRVHEISATGESAIDAMSSVIRGAAETRLGSAFWQMIGPT
jgi:hypothetical protein